MKRTITDEQDATPENLQYRVITVAFDQLPLQKKRELLPELLKSARVAHGLFLDPVTDKFRSWLTRGTIKQFTEEDVEKLWSWWCHVKETCTSASVLDTDDPLITHKTIYQDDFISDYEDTFYINHPRISKVDGSEIHRLKKEEYFEWLLINSLPEDVKLRIDDQFGEFYSFPDLTCDCCDLSPSALEDKHEWKQVFRPYVPDTAE
jgi:hypothetical protein